MIKKLSFILVLLGALYLVSPPQVAIGQEMELQGEVKEGTKEVPQSGFVAIVTGGGFVGILLWLALFGSSIAGVSLIVDSFINISEKKIVSETLVNNVRESMEQGDVMKAIGHCESEPGSLANILSAGFSNVEKGLKRFRIPLPSLQIWKVKNCYSELTI
ncbi:MAG: hypothetical protein GKR87_10125 [Kiritimatiellae bacterium]|nr:hypothetical protein [Kiritimatiellia bacterium]